MTGRLSSGKTSILLRVKAKTLPPAMATTATMTVKGCRKAKTMGFMLLPRRGRRPVSFQRRWDPLLEAGGGFVLVIREGLGGLPQRAVQAELCAVVVANRGVVVAVSLRQRLEGVDGLLRADERDQD